MDNREFRLSAFLIKQTPGTPGGTCDPKSPSQIQSLQVNAAGVLSCGNETHRRKKGWPWYLVRHFSIFCWQDLDHNPFAQTIEPNAVHQEHTEWWGQVILCSHASCLRYNAKSSRQHSLWPFPWATSLCICRNSTMPAHLNISLSLLLLIVSAYLPNSGSISGFITLLWQTACPCNLLSKLKYFS